MTQADFLTSFWTANGWEVVHRDTRKARPEERVGIDGLPIRARTRAYLESTFPTGLYRHQAEAIRRYLDGADVALCTGTASGKSAVFYAAGVEAIMQDPGARVLALYPLKALGREQEARWRAAFKAAALPAKRIGHIDGDVPTRDRLRILRECKVIVATPDVVHAWLVPNANLDEVWDFIRRLSLLVVDEVHVYSGVFGSNAAFLFRRLEHLARLSGHRYQCMTASATIKNPQGHMQALFGRAFELVDEAMDTSPQHEIDITMVQPPKSKDLTTSVAALLEALVRDTELKFIAFVDSRKQVETVASVLARSKVLSEDRADRLAASLKDMDVLPYRAGYEDGDRQEIERRLSSGNLRGVVSTSALELGIDIPHLDVGVLVGVPRSGTSLKQRIGRVGRTHPGRVVVINSGDVFSEAMFKKPSEMPIRPLAEGALYLENPRVQYIHAMCLARPFGEHDRAVERCGGGEDVPFSSDIEWPEGFLALCRKERAGEVPSDFQSMKAEAGETPHWAFPLRDVESQFSIEVRQGPDMRHLGSLSHSQLMREAYPGAVYYHIARAYRVQQVSFGNRTVRVKREKAYTTKPTILPSMVYPNLNPGSVHASCRFGSLALAETDLQVREAVTGYKERRGPNELTVQYPLKPSSGIVYAQPAFTRYYFTTGTILAHPALNEPGVKLESLATLLYECFLMEVPFERQDVNFASGTLKIGRGELGAGSRFIAIYDQTYGSLRLSGRLVDGDVAACSLERALDLAAEDDIYVLDEVTLECLRTLVAAAREPSTELFGSQAGRTDAVGYGEPGLPSRIRVITPGSMGLSRPHNDDEFTVEGVFFDPLQAQLRYRGRRAGMTDLSVKITLAIADVVPIPGESRMGWYELATGELIEDDTDEASAGKDPASD